MQDPYGPHGMYLSLVQSHHPECEDGTFENLHVYCEEFLHTFNIQICTHKTHLEVELLCSCSLKSTVVQGNTTKLTKNLMRYVHLEGTKTLWENRNSPWWNMKGIMLTFIQCHAWWLNPFCSILHNIYINLII
jgi:hypothetical protein